MIATKPLTIADLERMPDDGMRRELLEGVLLELPPAEWLHVCIAHNIHEAIRSVIAGGNLGRVFVEAGFAIAAQGRHWIQPDVSFIAAGRLPRGETPKFFPGAPDLAVEVISPSETAEDVNRKIELLLASGAQEIWAVYPKTRTVEIRRGDGSAAVLHEADTLHCAVLGGAPFPVRAFFAV